MINPQVSNQPHSNTEYKYKSLENSKDSFMDIKSGLELLLL